MQVLVSIVCANVVVHTDISSKVVIFFNAMILPEFNLPVDGVHTMSREVFIGTGKMPVAEKSTVSRQWRRVWRSQHKVPCAVDECAFFDGVCPPQNKHQVLAMAGKVENHVVGKFFPTAVLVRPGAMRPHCECGI